METQIRIRDAAPQDIAKMLEIYAYYVRDTAITFEYEVPSQEEFTDRFLNTTAHFPYLAAVTVENGREKVIGYAYAGRFHPRKAYERCAEMTVYIDRDARGSGAGRLLYEALEERLKDLGFLNLYACIGVPDEDDEYLTHNSEQFHEHMGYRLVGTFRLCGYKFGRWYNMIWMEKLIGEHR